MRRRTNSLTTIAIVMPAFLKSARLAMTHASRRLTSSTCSQLELSTVGAAGIRSKGLYTVASTYTHCF